MRPILAGLVAFLIAQAALAEEQTKTADSQTVFDEEGNQPTKGQIRIRVVDPDGQPVAAAKVKASIWTNDKDFKPTRDYKTDATGQVDVELPATLSILRLWVDKPQYVSIFKGWERSPPARRQKLPDEYTFKLQAGTTIGGIVVDDGGKPIAGAKMMIQGSPGGTLACETGEDGRWMLDTAPPGDLEIRVAATHPDFVSLRSYYDVGSEKPASLDELRAETLKTVMQRGVRVMGTITDPSGTPISGALAIWGDRPYWEARPQQEVRSDEQGIYRLPPLPAGPMNLTIVAEGWMPELRAIDVKSDMPPVDFQLKPGKTLRVRVVDIDGRPVPKVLLDIERWRDLESLYNRKHPNVLDSKIPRNADENGIYQWTWAPDDAVTFRLSAIGDFATPEVTLTASDREQVFTLPPVLRISGSVTDAKTGRPIDKFTVTQVEELSNDLLVTIRNKAMQRTGGTYVLDHLDWSDRAYHVRIEADGYRSAMSKGFRIGERNAAADFRLEPAPAADGKVVDAGGNPVPEVNMYLTTATQEARLSEDTDYAFSNNFRAKTNEHGKFSFPAQFEPYAIIAKGDSGYAEVHLQPDTTPGEIRLHPWTRVEGRLWQAGKPVPEARIFLTPLRPRIAGAPDIEDRMIALTDPEGHFVFERVAPIKCSVSAWLTPWEKFPITSSQSVPLDLKPGQQVTLNLGGEGTAIIGRVALRGQEAADFDLNWSLNYLLRKAPGIDLPEGLAGKEFDWRHGWHDSWTDSVEGNAYRQSLHHYSVRLNSDGTMLISGVPAGDYELALRIYEHKDPKACLVNPVASKIIPLHVSDAHVAKGSLDVGKITLDAALGPQPGDAAPDFQFETIDGAEAHLSDFRGKFVLAHFWATWCSTCVAQLPELEQMAQPSRGDDRLIILEINLDADVDQARRFAKEKKLVPTQGFLGEQSPTPSKLGISSVPVYLLITPDGRLAARCYSVEEIKKELAAVLATK